MSKLKSVWHTIRVAGLVVLALAVVIVLAAPRPSLQKHPERKQVRFWHMWSAEWKDVVDKIVDRYNKSQTEYEVVALSIPEGASTKMLLGITGGNPPDVMAQWESVIPTWAENKMIQPLETLMPPEEWDRFQREAYPAVKKLGMYKGHLYGITIGMNVFACYYRPDHFRAAGLDPDNFPKTLEELNALGEKLHQFDKKEQLRRIGYLPAGWTMLAPAFGGGFYDWKSNKVTLNTPQNLQALKHHVDYRKELGYDNIVRFQSGFGADSGASWSFIGGSQSIIVDGCWRVEQLRKEAPKLEYRLAPMPPPKGGQALAGNTGGNFMIIPSGAKNPQGAMDFIRFWSGLSNPERAAEFYTMGGWLPLSPAIANAPIYQEYIRKHPQFQAFVDMMPSENLHPAPPVPMQLFIQDKINQTQDLAVRGSLTPEQAIKKLEDDVRQEAARREALGYAN